MWKSFRLSWAKLPENLKKQRGNTQGRGIGRWPMGRSITAAPWSLISPMSVSSPVVTL